MMQHITRDAFASAMHAAVAERGADWIYPEAAENEDIRRANAPEWYTALGMCRYRLNNGAPACIIGAALEQMQRLDEVDVETWVGADALLTMLGSHDSGLESAADAAQSAQDQGKTWGEALEVFNGTLLKVAS